MFCLLISSCYCQTINVATAQMLIKQQSFTKFAIDIKKLIKQSKDKGSEIVVFPEDNSVNLINNSPLN